MLGTQNVSLQCPCCGETIELLVDPSIKSQEYVEDCSVCCRPLLITAVASEGEVLSVEARPEGG